MRAVTLADARKIGLLRSVTNYLYALAKPELESWKMEQACLAVLTSPRQDKEGLDAFVKRVLQVDREQAEEARRAAELGTRIHNAMASAVSNEAFDSELSQFILPAWDYLRHNGMLRKVIATEKILVGIGYAGRTDLISEDSQGDEWIVDYKSTKTLPKNESWPEHRLQLSAYAAARSMEPNRGNVHTIRTGNLYLSTSTPGDYVFHSNPNWLDTFVKGFCPILEYVIWRDGYDPRPFQVPTAITFP
jgi:PD-(D/E)XK nuclease superfamily